MLDEGIRSQIPREPTCDVELAARLMGISRGLAYEQARNGSLGGIPVLRIGSRLRVVTAPLLAALGLDPSPDGEAA